jgi:hypothetical protein
MGFLARVDGDKWLFVETMKRGGSSTMKRYLILAGLVALSLLLLLVWQRNGRHVSMPVNSDEPKQALAVGDLSKQSDHAAADVEPRKTVAEPTAAPTNQDDQYLQLVRKADESANIPVAFYGLVVDQDSNVLQNVSVDLAVMEEWSEPPPEGGTKIFPLQRQTGTDGRFEVISNSLRGKYVVIKALRKAGYEQEMSGRAMFGLPSISLDNPAVLTMWSTNIPHEQLITGDVISAVIPDGRRYGIDITNRAATEGAEGDLTVWLKRPTTVGWDKYDWSCELDANGGLLEDTGGQPMLVAPADGYTNVFTFNQEAVSSDWTHGLYDKHFYLRLRNGQIYGRITVNLTANPNRRAPAMLRVQYVINPSGSRLLR